jgi:sterol 3beta-glucosyltransferase
MQQLQITILTVGSRGDVQPYCALALELKQAGFRVQIATNRNFETFVTQLGLDFAPIAGDYKELLNSEAGQKLLAGQPSKLISDELLLEQMQDALVACQSTDILIFMMLALWGYHIAEKLRVPSFLAVTVPISPTRSFPFLQFAKVTADPIRGVLNYVSYLLVEFLTSQQGRQVTNRFRQDIGLPPLPWLGARYRRSPPPHLNPLPILYGFSSILVPKPSDWSEREQITGAWFLDQAQSYTPPQALLEFINAGTPPLCIGFGSMPDHHAGELTQIVLQALERTGQRGILLSGWADLGAALLPSAAKRVFSIDAVPHDWLFSQVAAVVHHCGAGTTAAVCRAGIPSIGVPFFADQPAWAQRLANLGVSPEPIPRKELSVERLAAAIQRAVSDSEMCRHAAELGERIRAEDGVAQAVEWIQNQL